MSPASRSPISRSGAAPAPPVRGMDEDAEAPPPRPPRASSQSCRSPPHQPQSRAVPGRVAVGQRGSTAATGRHRRPLAQHRPRQRRYPHTRPYPLGHLPQGRPGRRPGRAAARRHRDRAAVLDRRVRGDQRAVHAIRSLAREPVRTPLVLDLRQGIPGLAAGRPEAAGRSCLMGSAMEFCHWLSDRTAST